MEAAILAIEALHSLNESCLSLYSFAMHWFAMQLTKPETSCKVLALRHFPQVMILIFFFSYTISAGRTGEREHASEAIISIVTYIVVYTLVLTSIQKPQPKS